MDQPEKTDPVETMLREQNRYVNDDGFTARVVAALPRRRRAWLRLIVLLGTAVIGSVLAGQWLPWGSLSSIHLSALAALDLQVLMPWVTVVVVMGSIAWAAVAAVQWDD
jgi:hypothetical protein